MIGAVVRRNVPQIRTIQLQRPTPRKMVGTISQSTQMSQTTVNGNQPRFSLTVRNVGNSGIPNNVRIIPPNSQNQQQRQPNLMPTRVGMQRIGQNVQNIGNQGQTLQQVLIARKNPNSVNAVQQQQVSNSNPQLMPSYIIQRQVGVL